jgi:hypothetical protein
MRGQGLEARNVLEMILLEPGPDPPHPALTAPEAAHCSGVE